MDDPGKKCDICGERQLSANRWIRYRDPPAGDFLVKSKRSKIVSTHTHKDACGHTCALKAFNNWLVAVHVNAPVIAEEKKNETNA